jgi:hypothetical protein
MSTVVIDADVLGRRRTGDETYVRELLRALAAEDTSGLGLAAVTRRPELIPAGIEPVELPARSQVWRMSATSCIPSHSATTAPQSSRSRTSRSSATPP